MLVDSLLLELEEHEVVYGGVPEELEGFSYES